MSESKREREGQRGRERGEWERERGEERENEEKQFIGQHFRTPKNTAAVLRSFSFSSYFFYYPLIKFCIACVQKHIHSPDLFSRSEICMCCHAVHVVASDVFVIFSLYMIRSKYNDSALFACVGFIRWYEGSAIMFTPVPVSCLMYYNTTVVSNYSTLTREYLWLGANTKHNVLHLCLG